MSVNHFQTSCKKVCRHLVLLTHFHISLIFGMFQWLWPESPHQRNEKKKKGETTVFDGLIRTQDQKLDFDRLLRIQDQKLYFDWLIRTQDHRLDFNWLIGAQDQSLDFDWLMRTRSLRLDFDWLIWTHEQRLDFLLDLGVAAEIQTKREKSNLRGLRLSNFHISFGLPY